MSDSSSAPAVSREVIAAVLQRAATDAAFRELAKQDPHEAVRQATGVDIDDDVRLKFVEPAG